MYEKEYYLKSKNRMNETVEKLIEMKSKWEELDIVHYFAEVHHFSNEEFTSIAPSLDEHYDYCIDKNIQYENIQTLKRGLKVVKLCSDGLDIDDAIKQSWAEYPILITSVKKLT